MCYPSVYFMREISPNIMQAYTLFTRNSAAFNHISHHLTIFGHMMNKRIRWTHLLVIESKYGKKKLMFLIQNYQGNFSGKKWFSPSV